MSLEESSRSLILLFDYLFRNANALLIILNNFFSESLIAIKPITPVCKESIKIKVEPLINY